MIIDNNTNFTPSDILEESFVAQDVNHSREASGEFDILVNWPINTNSIPLTYPPLLPPSPPMDNNGLMINNWQPILPKTENWFGNNHQLLVDHTLFHEPLMHTQNLSNLFFPHPNSTQRRCRRRSSSHRSVASVVSLTANEPKSEIIDGVEYILFFYSHERNVQRYKVRTDVDRVNIDDIPMDFRIQNAIYPRANVDKSEYDGNRWDYETTCNILGWKLCWLNRQELYCKRGLIQRAVDAYRNRHSEMRSRRVTRQEKVANGTLRKRRSKKAINFNCPA